MLNLISEDAAGFWLNPLPTTGCHPGTWHCKSDVRECDDATHRRHDFNRPSNQPYVAFKLKSCVESVGGQEKDAARKRAASSTGDAARNGFEGTSTG